VDPWTRFEAALHASGSGVSVAELKAVLVDLETTKQGGPVDRQVLRASASALLAEAGVVPLNEALIEVEAAVALGQPGWPCLYATMAALGQDEPWFALRVIRMVPDGLFDRENLGWRTVQLSTFEAQALVLLGDLDAAEPIIEHLNTRFRDEDADDELYMRPWGLVGALLHKAPERELLASLLDGLEVRKWLNASLAEEVEQALRASS
jgi:hypothetical protein